MASFFDTKRHSWANVVQISVATFVCGYCSEKVSSDRGYYAAPPSGGAHSGHIFICPNCSAPTFISVFDEQYPFPPLGGDVKSVPPDLKALYDEARGCTAQRSFTGAVLLCRKMLMNIAVHQGADEGLSFIKYVDYLEANHFTPPNGRTWVDHIRKKGNEATHEIAVMSADDAQDLLVFVQMLLKFIYEFPSMITL